MKRLSFLIYSLLYILFITGEKCNAQSSSSVSTTGHIFAEIISVYSANETSQLNFGRFSPGVQGGQLILTPQSTISVLGSVFKGSGSHNAASFYVTGEENATFSITLPSDPVVLTHISNAKTMQVKDWASIPAPGIGTGKLQDGFQIVYVGATLNVGTISDNPVGVYTGSYSITFDFN